MLRDATFGAFVATSAEIHVEDEDAPAFVEALLDVVADERIDIGVRARTVGKPLRRGIELPGS